MGSTGLVTIIMIAVLVLLFVFTTRSSRKQERETNEMRNNLEVGDEITTIGGIIGEIVSLKEETVTIETSKAKTKIRVLRSAIRCVDVRAAEKRGAKAIAEGKKPDDNANNDTKENAEEINNKADENSESKEEKKEN